MCRKIWREIFEKFAKFWEINKAERLFGFLAIILKSHFTNSYFSTLHVIDYKWTLSYFFTPWYVDFF